MAALSLLNEALAEARAERAALLEIDGGLPRVRAQEVAELAGLYYSHHWSCTTCRAGTQVGAGLYRPCQEGAKLWDDYCAAAAAGGAR